MRLVTTNDDAGTDANHDLTNEEARKLTDEVKADVEALSVKMLRLYEGKAHLALGYQSWDKYCAAEFDLGKSHAYRLLDAGRVVGALSQSPNGEPVSEGVARELASVLKSEGPEAVADIYAAATREYGPKPTAKQVRAAAGVIQETGGDDLRTALLSPSRPGPSRWSTAADEGGLIREHGPLKPRASKRWNLPQPKESVHQPEPRPSEPSQTNGVSTMACRTESASELIAHATREVKKVLSPMYTLNEPDKKKLRSIADLINQELGR